MKHNINVEQLDAWLRKRAEKSSLDLAEHYNCEISKDSCAFKLGILEATFVSVLTNTEQRREFLKEISKQ